MASIIDTVLNAFKGNGGNAAQNARALISSEEGDSGTLGTGIDVSGSTVITPSIGTFRQVRVDGAGNFGFTMPDGSIHVIALAANEEFTSKFISTIYPASYATAALRTTATGVHIFK